MKFGYTIIYVPDVAEAPVSCVRYPDGTLVEPCSPMGADG